MDIKQRTEMLTVAYIHAYRLAINEVKNPSLATQIATSVIMVINMGMKNQQIITPLELLFTQMASVAEEKEESEATDHDGQEDAGNKHVDKEKK